MSYSKLFASIIHSSLWSEPDPARILFITLLAVSDREGFVFGSRKGLERAANISPPDGTDWPADQNPWTILMSPDPDSSDLLRNPDNEGRRVEEVDGGFRLLNFLHYRSLRNDDDRREQNRRAQEKFRGKTVSQRKPRVSSRKQKIEKVSQRKPISDTEAYSEADSEEDVVEAGNVGRMKRPNGVIDSEWLSRLKSNDAYHGIDVDRELGKMNSWCSVNGKMPTRRRFVNWLNRAERPLRLGARAPDKADRQHKINQLVQLKQEIHRRLIPADPRDPRYDRNLGRELHRVEAELAALREELL